jgi:hypothetical protein
VLSPEVEGAYVGRFAPGVRTRKDQCFATPVDQGFTEQLGVTTARSLQNPMLIFEQILPTSKQQNDPTSHIEEPPPGKGT